MTVYCRSGYTEKDVSFYRGVKLVVLPTIRHKYFDTISHTFFSVMHVLFTRTDVIYFCNVVNSIFTFFPRLRGIKTVINVDGLEWKRKKWNSLARFIYRVSEFLATILPNAIITDSHGICTYYKKKFGKNTEYISYGADTEKYIAPGPVMEKWNLKKGRFFLYVSRLEPENNAHVIIWAYKNVKGDMPLVIVGDAPYNKPYINKLKATDDKRVKFTGSIYGDGYFELLSNAFAYIHGNEVGGTNPALLQAMASAKCVIVNGVDFNKEVIEDCGLWFKPGDAMGLKKKMEYILNNPQKAEEYGVAAKKRIKKCYNWDMVIDKTELFMERLIGKNRIQQE